MVFRLLIGVAIAQLVPSGRSVPPSDELTAAAAASPRPVDCQKAASAGREAAWQRARTPGLDAFCTALARGYAELAQSPSRALESAKHADAVLPFRAAPKVLQGEALVALGRYAPAWESFARARALSAHALESPAALYDFAVAAMLTGHLAEARDAYRALVARAGLIDDGVQRMRAYVEAAAQVMAEGPEGLDEAIGYLGEARRRGIPPGLAAYVLGALALALDRQGNADEARGVASEAGGPWALLRRQDAETEHRAAPSTTPDDVAPRLPEGEIDAMIAVLAERADAAVAREHWQAFLASSAGSGRWAEHAQKKLQALETRRPARGRK